MLNAIRSVWAPPHRAGQPFIAGGLGAAAAGLFLTPWLIAAGLAFAAFCLFFFRDPERTPPPIAGSILAPADGCVVGIQELAPPRELEIGEAPRWRVSIFLSILDVHVNRVPAAGTVIAVRYHPGTFVNAALDKASDTNERNAISLALPDGRAIGVVQIAGLIARRIRCGLRPGDTVAAGARFGIIRFGSRTDLWLPEGCTPWVSVGQRMVGGETIMGLLDTKR